MSNPSQPLPTGASPRTVGIRALKQNASEVVARAAAGETIEITDRGRPVAQLIPLLHDRLESLTAAGRITQPRRSLADYLDSKQLRDAVNPARSVPSVESAELLREQRADRL